MIVTTEMLVLKAPRNIIAVIIIFLALVTRSAKCKHRNVINVSCGHGCTIQIYLSERRNLEDDALRNNQTENSDQSFRNSTLSSTLPPPLPTPAPPTPAPSTPAPPTPAPPTPAPPTPAPPTPAPPTPAPYPYPNPNQTPIPIQALALTSPPGPEPAPIQFPIPAPTQTPAPGPNETVNSSVIPSCKQSNVYPRKYRVLSATEVTQLEKLAEMRKHFDYAYDMYTKYADRQGRKLVVAIPCGVNCSLKIIQRNRDSRYERIVMLRGIYSGLSIDCWNYTGTYMAMVTNATTVSLDDMGFILEDPSFNNLINDAEMLFRKHMDAAENHTFSWRLPCGDNCTLMIRHRVNDDNFDERTLSITRHYPNNLFGKLSLTDEPPNKSDPVVMTVLGSNRHKREGKSIEKMFKYKFDLKRLLKDKLLKDILNLTKKWFDRYPPVGYKKYLMYIPCGIDCTLKVIYKNQKKMKFSRQKKTGCGQRIKGLFRRIMHCAKLWFKKYKDIKNRSYPWYIPCGSNCSMKIIHSYNDGVYGWDLAYDKRGHKSFLGNDRTPDLSSYTSDPAADAISKLDRFVYLELAKSKKSDLLRDPLLKKILSAAKKLFKRYKNIPNRRFPWTLPCNHNCTMEITHRYKNGSYMRSLKLKGALLAEKDKTKYSNQQSSQNAVHPCQGLYSCLENGDTERFLNDIVIKEILAYSKKWFNRHQRDVNLSYSWLIPYGPQSTYRILHRYHNGSYCRVIEYSNRSLGDFTDLVYRNRYRINIPPTMTKHSLKHGRMATRSLCLRHNQ